jgi:RNA polymerase sigma-70 factor (ECF subfamily)
VRVALAHYRECRGNLHIRVWLLTILHDLRDNPFRQLTAATLPAADPAALLTLSALDRALGQLPEEQRAAILLVGLENMTYAETASILRLSVNAVRSRLSRARTSLRRSMGVAQPLAMPRAA